MFIAMTKFSYILFFFYYFRNFGVAVETFVKAFDYMANIRGFTYNCLLNFYSSLSFAGIAFDHTPVGGVGSLE